MELLRFTDGNGREWEVFEVGARAPLADRALPASQSYRGPERWLCFASATERRRLARYPQLWHALTPPELEALCRAAAPAREIPRWVPRQLPGDASAGGQEPPRPDARPDAPRRRP
jgi:hypothetical protein